MESKKIDIIVKYFYPVAAGIETNIAETYSVLAKRGWDITLHTSNDTLTQKRVLKKKDSVRGIEVKRYPFSKFGYLPDVDWNTTGIVALHNFDVFPHVRVLLHVLLLKLLGRKHFKLVLTPHGGYTPEWSTFSTMQQFIKKTYHKTLGAWLINKTVDVLRAVSEWEYDEVVSYGVNKKLVVVIPNGVEKEAYLDVEKVVGKEIVSQVKKYGKYIIQVGRIYPIKNYETTIRALTKIDPTINFVIVGPEDHVLGKSDYKKSLILLAKNLGVEDRVFFAGVLRGVDKYYIIKKAQMMVHMALWESFCNVVHEGLSQGLVCVVANNTALPYLIKDKVNGYCVATRDYLSVAKRVNFVLANKNKEVVRIMQQRNRKYGLKNSWNKVALEVETLYQNLS